MENGAFGSASTLERLVLPFELKEITASDECPNLKEIYITPTNGYYKTLDGLLYNKSGRELVWYPQGKDSEELILSEQLDSIRSFALKGCKVKRVTIPESVTEVGISAFASSALEEVTFPQGLTHIRKGVAGMQTTEKGLPGKEYTVCRRLLDCPLPREGALCVCRRTSVLQHRCLWIQ